MWCVVQNEVAFNSTDPVYRYPLCNFEGCEKNGTQREKVCGGGEGGVVFVFSRVHDMWL